MEQLPVEKVPKIRSEGGKYRARQLFYQLPRQDFSTKYAKFLHEDAKQSFLDLNEERREYVIGIGRFYHTHSHSLTFSSLLLSLIKFYEPFPIICQFSNVLVSRIVFLRLQFQCCHAVFF